MNDDFKDFVVFQKIDPDAGISVYLHEYHYPDDWRIWEHRFSQALRIDEDTESNRQTRERFGFVDQGTVGEFVARVKAKRAVNKQK